MAAQRELLQHSQLRQHGEFWHVSVSERQRSRPCGQNLRVPFLRTVLPPEVEESARAMAATARQKRSYQQDSSRRENRRESTTPGTRKTGKLFFFLLLLLLSSFFRRASSTSTQSLMMVFARNSSISHRVVHLAIAFSQPPSFHQAAAAAHSITMASLVTPFSRLYACVIT